MSLLVALKPFDPVSLILIGLLNPIVIAIAVLMGRNADQPQKLVVAAFAASLAGVIFIWLLTNFKILPVHGFGQTSGLLIVQFLIGLVWAWVGFRFVRSKSG